MVEQTSLLAVTNEAIDRAAAHAETEWWTGAQAAVKLLCRRNRDFTTDAVWYLLAYRGLKPHEPRALGAIMLWAVKEGLVRPTGEYHKSVRPECHRRPLTVWRPATQPVREKIGSATI